MSKGVVHALDFDLRLVPPAVMAPLQRRIDGGLGQTLSVLLGSAVSELAWERAKLSTCFGGLGIRVAQMGFAAQATYWSAVDLHKAFMSNICAALNRPLREPHPEEAIVLAAKADLLVAGSLLTSTPGSWLRTRPADCTRQARGQRTSGLRRSSAWLLCSPLTMSRR